MASRDLAAILLSPIGLGFVVGVATGMAIEAFKPPYFFAANGMPITTPVETRLLASAAAGTIVGTAWYVYGTYMT